MNTIIAAYGGRMTLVPLDPEAVERWMEEKQAQVGETTLSAAQLSCFVKLGSLRALRMSILLQIQYCQMNSSIATTATHT